MGAAARFLIGIILTVVSLGGLAYGLHEMMTHADPNDALVALSGLAVFVVGSLATLLVSTY